MNAMSAESSCAGSRRDDSGGPVWSLSNEDGAVPDDVAAMAGHPAALRVLLVTDEMEVGGTQRQIVHLARGLAARGCKVDVVYFRKPSYLVDELRDAGIGVGELPKRWRIDPRFVGGLYRLIRHGRYDVMHCFSFTGELWGAVARRLVHPGWRPPLITSIRGKYERFSAVHWSLKGWTARESACVVTNSRAGGVYALGRLRLDGGHIRVVANGVAIPPVPADPPDEGAPICLFAGRLVDDKNLPLLLEAHREVVAGGIDLRLRIAGDGPRMSDCRERLEQLGTSRSVELLGERSDVGDLLAASHFVVLTSLREGLSNVVLEAMASGRAVVASDVGGNPELVLDGETGLLFRSGDGAALGGALARLATDSGLRRRLGRAGRERAIREFSIAAMVNRMYDIYVDAASTAGRTS